VTALSANLLLAVLWAALTGNFTVPNLLAGLVLGYFVLTWGLRDLPTFANYRTKVPGAIRFLGFFLWDLLRSNLRVAHDVLTPTHHMKPGVIGVPLEARTDAEITALANLITLTPGTLSLDVSTDRQVLYVHVMYLDDETEVINGIKELEQKLLELMR
jgi:multicomponent Na+:H+ antiporter subunit E